MTQFKTKAPEWRCFVVCLERGKMKFFAGYEWTWSWMILEYPNYANTYMFMTWFRHWYVCGHVLVVWVHRQPVWDPMYTLMYRDSRTPQWPGVNTSDVSSISVYKPWLPVGFSFRMSPGGQFPSGPFRASSPTHSLMTIMQIWHFPHQVQHTHAYLITAGIDC